MSILNSALELIILGLLIPLFAVSITGIFINFIFSLFQIQEQTFSYLIKLIVGSGAIYFYYPSWQSQFIKFVKICLEQMIDIGIS